MAGISGPEEVGGKKEDATACIVWYNVKYNTKGRGLPFSRPGKQADVEKEFFAFSLWSV